ncbi:MAG: glycosyltransferase family 4 protein, partial [Ignavibacteria bacterium]|nr:glycosyltransferase family 4 protein [Ignavibacteria bacterium]
DERIRFLPHCVEQFPQTNDNELLNLKLKLSINRDDFVILFVGRLHRDKGYDLLISAFKVLVTMHKNLKLILIGSFEEKIAYELIKSPNVIYIHPTEDYYKYYQISNVVVLPSRIDPFPLVMLETGWFSKPFIGGKTPGIMEVIKHKKNGLLFEVDNVSDLIFQIDWGIKNQSELLNYAKELHNDVIENYSDTKKYFYTIENIYKALLK